MSTSEFLYRVLADADFRPFGIAQYELGARFELPPGGSLGASSSPESSK
ncbi:hypothetical protein ACFU98_00865 [Streptomyces sp. NPDC057575]